MDLTFNTRGNRKQFECAKAWVDPNITDIVYGGAKGGAKSFTGVSLIFGDALLHPGTHYFIARKALNDLRKYTIPSIHEVLEDVWKLPRSYFNFNGQDNLFILHNGSRVYLIEAKPLPSDREYMRFGSMQMTRGWIEEAGEFEEAAKNNLMASIGRWKNKDYDLTGKLLQTCNPAKNYLYRQYYKPHKEDKLKPWRKFITALPQDNKMLAPEYIEMLNQTLSKNQRARLLLGHWEYDDDPTTMISFDAILDYFKNIHIERDPSKMYMTIDVARLGQDKTIFRVWEGWVCIKRHSMDVSRVTEVADKAKDLMKLHSVPLSKVIADEDGVGGGVVDILRCKGFVNNSSPLKMQGAKKNYGNLKDQCSFLMAQMINDRKIAELCEDGEVIDRVTEEMEQVKQEETSDVSKLKVVSKSIVKDFLGRSPDDWDSIMMRYWFELGFIRIY